MIKIDTIGYGSVKIDEDENSFTITAEPVKGCDFKEFSINGITTKENPYSFEKTGDVTGAATFYQSINSYLENSVQQIDVSGLIPGILLFRNVEYGADIKELDWKDVELCKADVFYECTNIPSSRQLKKGSDSGYSEDEGGFSMDSFTKNSLIAQALAIYTKYEDERADEVQQVNMNKRTIVEYLSSKPGAAAPEKVEVNAEFLGL